MEISGRYLPDVASDSDSVWTWLEFSSDNGTTWRQDIIHAVGHVGTIQTGTARKARWMVDGDKGASCRIRVRGNDNPAWYIRENTTYMDTTSDGPQDCPKPIPMDDPYATLERMLNNKWQDILMNRSEYRLPFYQSNGQAQTISTDWVKGNDFTVGMAKVSRATTCYPALTAGFYTRASYSD
jgi:hypothetical protein